MVPSLLTDDGAIGTSERDTTTDDLPSGIVNGLLPSVPPVFVMGGVHPKDNMATVSNASAVDVEVAAVVLGSGSDCS